MPIKLENSVRFPHLLKADFLKNLAPDFQKSILNQCAVLTFDSTKPVLMQGGPSDGMYIVAHGVVSIHYLGPRGQRVFVTREETGSVFGDLEAIAGKPCAASCEATKNTTLLFCPTPLLFSHLKSVVFVQNLMAILHARLESDNVFKLVDHCSPVTQRLCSYLHFLSRNNSRINETQSYLAEVVRCSRQTINKELGKLRNLGIISLQSRTVIIEDRERLAEMSDHTDDDYLVARN